MQIASLGADSKKEREARSLFEEGERAQSLFLERRRKRDRCLGRRGERDHCLCGREKSAIAVWGRRGRRDHRRQTFCRKTFCSSFSQLLVRMGLIETYNFPWDN
ncbi:MAG: hypothetical protein GVY04_10245 [Cyanobacteria bacterium]|nr:hypothetical protein [Cyanobacteria bacterium GSL.Bin1]